MPKHSEDAFGLRRFLIDEVAPAEVMSEYELLRRLERAVRDLFLWPFDKNHPAEPDAEAMGQMLVRLDEVRRGK